MDENLLHDLVGAALKAGADQAEAVFANRRALSVTVRMGELEEVERVSEIWDRLGLPGDGSPIWKSQA